MTEKEKLMKEFSSIIKKVTLIVLSLIMVISMTGCYGIITHSSSSSSSSSASSKDITVSDVPTSYPKLYKYDDSPKYNTYIKSKIISYKKARKYIGKDMTVQGKVSSVYYVPSANGRPYFINFGDRQFCIVIWSDDLSTFDTNYLDLLVEWSMSDEPLKVYMRVSGTISSYNGEPQIVARNGSQVADKTEDGWMNLINDVTWDDVYEQWHALKDKGL